MLTPRRGTSQILIHVTLILKADLLVKILKDTGSIYPSRQGTKYYGRLSNQTKTSSAHQIYVTMILKAGLLVKKSICRKFIYSPRLWYIIKPDQDVFNTINPAITSLFTMVDY